MESNVMAGRALLGCLQLPTGQSRHAIFLVLDKTMQGSNKSAAHRAYRRIAPRSFEVVPPSTICSLYILWSANGQYAEHTDCFDPCQDWPHPIELNGNIPLVLQQLTFMETLEAAESH